MSSQELFSYSYIVRNFWSLFFKFILVLLIGASLLFIAAHLIKVWQFSYGAQLPLKHEIESHIGTTLTLFSTFIALFVLLSMFVNYKYFEKEKEDLKQIKEDSKKEIEKHKEDMRNNSARIQAEIKCFLAQVRDEVRSELKKARPDVNMESVDSLFRQKES